MNIRETFRRRTEVLVIGGGPAGLAAAVCAARCGVKVMLAEAGGCLGGSATLALVGPFMTCYDRDGKNQIIRGFYEELVSRLERENGGIHPSKCPPKSSYSAYREKGHSNVGPFNSDVLKRVAEDLCLESGVELLYHAALIDVEKTGNRVTGAVLAVPGGAGVVEAEVFVDCTGNGDAAFLSGAPMDKPDEVQPASMFFLVDGVDKEAYEAMKDSGCDDLVFAKLVEKLYADGKYPIEKRNVGLYESCDGTWRVNMTRLNRADATDPFEATKAAVALRHQIPVVVDMLKTYVPVCKNLRVLATADQQGYRESRRIVGDFVLQAEDMKNSVIYEDNIALCANAFDMHVGNTVKYVEAPEKPYGIPYRILLPRNVENLLAAGRCVSCSRDALAAIRVMPPCFAMGQAAGSAAAIAFSRKCRAAEIDTALLQAKLREQGAVVSYEDIPQKE